MNVFDLTGRKALVTGGARGLGAGMAEALAEAGAAVMIGDLLEDRPAATAEKIAASGARAVRAAGRHRRGGLGGRGRRHRRGARRLRHPGQQRRGRDVRADGRRRSRRTCADARGQRRRHRARHQARLPRDAPRRRRRARAARSSTSPRSRRRSRSPASPDTRRPSPRSTGSPASPPMESGKLGYGVRVNCVYPGLVPTEMGSSWPPDMVDARPVAQHRGGGRRRHRADAARSARRGRRHGRRGGIPRLGRGPLHHRRRACRSTAAWACDAFLFVPIFLTNSATVGSTPANPWARPGSPASISSRAVRKALTMSTKPVVVYGAPVTPGGSSVNTCASSTFRSPLPDGTRTGSRSHGQDPRDRDCRPRHRRGGARRRVADRPLPADRRWSATWSARSSSTAREVVEAGLAAGCH